MNWTHNRVDCLIRKYYLRNSEILRYNNIQINKNILLTSQNITKHIVSEKLIPHVIGLTLNAQQQAPAVGNGWMREYRILFVPTCSRVSQINANWPIICKVQYVVCIIGLFEAGRGAAARGVTAKPTGCGFDSHSRRWNIYLNLYFHFFALVSRLSPALSSATQHAMPPEFGRKWGTECLNTRFPLPTLLCAG